MKLEERIKRERKFRKFEKIAKYAEKGLQITQAIALSKGSKLSFALGLISGAGFIKEVFASAPSEEASSEEVACGLGASKQFPAFAAFFYELFINDDSFDKYIAYKGKYSELVAFTHKTADLIILFDRHADYGTIIASAMYMEDEKVKTLIQIVKDKFAKNDEKKFSIVGCIDKDKTTGGFSTPRTALKLEPINFSDEIYVPTVSIDEYMKRLNKLWEYSNTRSAILAGVPGAGKTCFASKLADNLNTSLLVIPYNKLTSLSAMEIVAALSIIDGRVILLDDMDRGDCKKILDLVSGLNSFKYDKPVVILSAVNHLGKLPSALKRPGRFDEIIPFELPTLEQRDKIIMAYCNKYGFRPGGPFREKLSAITNGLSPAYLKEVALQASAFGEENIDMVVENIKKFNNSEDFAGSGVEYGNSIDDDDDEIL